MPRQSYREHRAARAHSAAPYGSEADLESIASYSTLASHTTLASVAGRPSSFAFASARYHPSQHYLPEDLPSPTSGSGSGYSHRDSSSGGTGGLGASWLAAGAAGPGGAAGATQSSGGPSRSISGMLSPRITATPPAPPSPKPGAPLPPSPTSPTGSASLLPPRPPIHHRRTNSTSSLLSSPKRHSHSPSAAHLAAAPPPAPAAVTRIKRNHSKEQDNEKRRKTERNAERWRRVRAREAAHDAPVRRWAKAAYSRFGARGAMVAAVVGAVVLRILLTLITLYISPKVRATLHHQVAAARLACSHPPLKTVAPICAATIGKQGTPVTATAGAALIAAHLTLEGVLGWGAAIAWAIIEGWQQGRTVRTRVAAVVYLILAPVLTLSDSGLLLMRTAPLGLMAWAILAACSGHDGAAAATIAASAWSDRAGRVYAPAFAVYAIGKRIWLGPKGKGYLARLAVSASLVLTALGSLQPVPLRARAMDLVATVRSCTSSAALWALVRAAFGLITLRGVITFLALVPSTYLMIRASYVLRPSPTEPYTSHSLPATARLLPIMFTAVAGAMALPDADAALPLLPLSLASSLRGDDDEWAVAVQVHHLAAMCLWPRFGRLIPLAASVQLAWAWLIGARRDAPNPLLQAYQHLTSVLLAAALVPWPTVLHTLLARVDVPTSVTSRLPDAADALGALVIAHRVFVMVSIGLLVVWTNIRLVKAAWAIGAL